MQPVPIAHYCECCAATPLLLHAFCCSVNVWRWREETRRLETPLGNLLKTGKSRGAVSDNQREHSSVD